MGLFWSDGKLGGLRDGHVSDKVGVTNDVGNIS